MEKESSEKMKIVRFCDSVSRDILGYRRLSCPNLIGQSEILGFDFHNGMGKGFLE
jgi:hypothetical protein